MSTRFQDNNANTPITASWLNQVDDTLQLPTQEIWKWNGAIMDGDQVILVVGSFALYGTDAAYGRKLTINPSGGFANAIMTVKTASMLPVGTKITVAGRVLLPTMPGGATCAISLLVAGVAATSITYTSANSGQVVDFSLPFILLTVPATIGIGLVGASLTSGIDFYSMSIYHGSVVPTRQVPNYPKNTVSYSSAAPVTGTWKAGDQVMNSTPSVGSPKAWRCTVTGTPGTWVSEGNL